MRNELRHEYLIHLRHDSCTSVKCSMLVCDMNLAFVYIYALMHENFLGDQRVYIHTHTQPRVPENWNKIAGTKQNCALVPSQSCTACHRVVPGSGTHDQEASSALHIDRRSSATVKHSFVRKLRVTFKNLNTCDHWFYLIGTRKVDMIFLGPNLKSAVTCIQILMYYSTFVQTNVPQLQSVRDQYIYIYIHWCT